MKLKNKNYEIIKLEVYVLIVALLGILSVIFIPINEFKIIAAVVFAIIMIFLIQQVVIKQKLNNVSVGNYEPKSNEGIKMEVIDDQYATGFRVIGPSNDEVGYSEYSGFNMVEGDLEADKEQHTIKPEYTNLNNFDTKKTENNETIFDTNDTKTQGIKTEESNVIYRKSSDNIENEILKIDTQITEKKSQTQPSEAYQTETTTKNTDNQNTFGTNTKTDPYKKILIPVNIEENKKLNLNSKRDNFSYFIEKFFVIIRSKLNDVNTLAFVWVNYNSETLEFGHLSSNDEDTKQSLIQKHQQIPIGDDLISKFVQKEYQKHTGEIFTEMRNPAQELNYFSYYTKPVGTNSFICIPIYFRDNIIAVLCADSKKTNAFNDDYSFLEKFTHPITGLIYTFHNVIRQEKEEQTTKLIADFDKLISQHKANFNTICNAITEYIYTIYSCTSIGIVAYNKKTKKWTIPSYRTMEDVDNEFINESIDLGSTIIGKCITTTKIISVANIPSDYVRVNKYEPTINNGSFIAVPIHTITDEYAIFVEFKDDPNVATTINVNILETICKQAGKKLEKFRLKQFYTKNVDTENKTGILTGTGFEKRLQEEFHKAIDNNSKITLALISLNKYAAIEDADNDTKFLISNKIIEFIRANIKQYEIIGRVSDDVLGVILFNKNISQSKIILEKIKEQIATNTIEVKNKKFILSVSIGLGNINPKNTYNDFTSNVTIALRKAEERNNSIQLFE